MEAVLAIEKLIEGFSNFMRAHMKAAKTQTEYLRDVRDWAAWWKRDPAEFTPIDFDSWTFKMVEDGYAGRSVRRHQAGVRKFFKYLIRMGVAERDPGLGSEAVNVPKRLPEWLEESEVENMIGHCDSLRAKAMFRLLYSCGLRNGEMRGVLLQNVTAEYVRVIGKRDKERTVPMAPAAWKAVEAYLPTRPRLSSPLLFISCNGKPVDELQICKLVHNAAVRVGIKKHVTPHTLRHSIATHMLNRGMDLRFIMEFLGHENIATTQRYTHVAKTVLTSEVAKHHPGFNAG